MANKKKLKPFTLLIKPVGSRCNLDCEYCFYLGTDENLGGGRPAVMAPGVQEQMISDYLSYGFPTSAFTWQGGEPTLAGLDFYRQAVDLQIKHGRGGQAVANALQTNGILLDDEWAKFLAEYRFLVGLSLDGPAKVHDHYRKDRRGNPTFDKVMAAAETMRKNRVEFNILTMITGRNEDLGRETYHWLVDQGFLHLQFIPCVEYDPGSGEPAPQNCSPRGYGKFLCDVFDEWHAQDVGRVSVRTFEGVVALMADMPQLGICNMGRTCDHYLVVEKQGDVYPCDFFVSTEYQLGNLMDTPLRELYLSDREHSFSLLKSNFAQKCRTCPYLEFCYGGCPKDRLTSGHGKFSQPTWLCEGLTMFFDHTRQRLAALADTVRQPPVHQAGASFQENKTGQPGRNAPCPCGSGKKYKHCCLNK